MAAWELLALVTALSLDGFFAGLAFGLRQIRAPARSLVVLAFCSTAVLGGAMLAGRLLAGLAGAAPGLSGWILVGLGLWRLAQGLVEAHAGKDGPLLSLTVPRTGLVIQVLADPTQADRDLSGSLDVSEAILLGVALSLDALAVGLAVASLPVSPYLPLWVGAGLYGFTRGGMALAGPLGERVLRGRGLLLPGLILVLLGMLRFGRGGP